MFSDQNFILSLIISIFVGASAGYLGSIMILRRMALVGDALSHVALPGMGIALTYNLNPFVFAFLFLAFASYLIWYLETKTEIPTEALVGVFFTASLAIGILITPEIELIEALFGDISKVTFLSGILTTFLSIFIFIVTAKIYKNLILGTISEDLIISIGINIRKINLIFLLLVALSIALGVRVVGTLLMGALVIISAVSAKNLSKNMKNYAFLSTIFGLISAPSGVILARLFEFPPGPVVVLVSILIFLISLIIKIIK